MDRSTAQRALHGLKQRVQLHRHQFSAGGGWRMDDNDKDFGGGAYWTEPARPDEAPRTALWRTGNPMLGRYRISVWYGKLVEGGLATDAQYTVKTRTGALTNRAGGRILADALKFEREE